jgi:hypothetical protein
MKKFTDKNLPNTPATIDFGAASNRSLEFSIRESTPFALNPLASFKRMATH